MNIPVEIKDKLDNAERKPCARDRIPKPAPQSRSFNENWQPSTELNLFVN